MDTPPSPARPYTHAPFPGVEGAREGAEGGEALRHPGRSSPAFFDPVVAWRGVAWRGGVWRRGVPGHPISAT
ncbi:hypothetical protein E2C01_004556 [Portunus trituberculatus]|uniref:Uncharacterized protein n=1 Tax=Portunus trituberculatus TaxID=210409 RepID=A0A5B7CSN1_PORTR|nr:hypothetical protein [Portunus trituberculatus]